MKLQIGLSELVRNCYKFCRIDMDHLFLFILAIVSSFLMSWAIGANDVANAMGTSVGSKTISMRQAIVIAAIFEALGAFSASGQVTQTLRQGIVSPHHFVDDPFVLVFGMLSALFASATWLILATYRGWPVSTTHTIIGAIVGFAMVTVGPSQINWSLASDVVMSWVFTPLLSAIGAFLLFKSIYFFVLARKKPDQAAIICLPIYVFFSVMVTVLITLLQGLKPLGFNISLSQATLFSFFIALVATVSVFLSIKNIVDNDQMDPFHFNFVERSFGVLTVFTACSMAFAHGSNDVANAIGPLAAIVDILNHQQHLVEAAPIPIWIVTLGSVGVVLGLAMYGYRIMDTVGSKITTLTPSRSFSAQMSTAIVVILSSGFGFPVSTTQTLVGALLGVGFARGISALNLNVVRSIFSSWLITLPCGALLSISYYFILSWGLR